MLPLVTMECRVTAEPGLRFTNSGMAVTKMRCVAVSRKKDENDQWVDDKTCWLDVVCFKKLAENVAESIEKGDLIVVSGRLSQSEWTTKEGEKRVSYEVAADTVGAALVFRTIPHGAGKAQRASDTTTEPVADPWATVPAEPATDEPPPF